MASSVSLRQSSTRSYSSSSASRMSSGSVLTGGGSGRAARTSAASMYGGYSSYGLSGSYGAASGVAGWELDSSSITTNEKLTMQNLNDRLASYLDKVRSLEAANRKLEVQIRQYLESRGPGAVRDYTAYFVTINDLREKIRMRYCENQRITLQMDNAQMAAEDFKNKQDLETTMRMNVEADISRLRGFKDSLTLSIGDLKMQLDGLKEELAYLRSNHEEEMRLMRTQISGDVTVDVDAGTSQVDLAKIMEEMREQYETLIMKNKQDQEKWFNAQMLTLQTQIETKTTEVKTFTSELSELKRTYQTVEISLQSILKEIECLQRNLEEVNGRYSIQLSQYQMSITTLEAELQQLKLSVEKQQTEYAVLLDIKMRLELEIAEYRRLLEGEVRQYREERVVVTKVVEEPPPQPKVEKRVKVITEEIIDGVVVASSVDTQVEQVQ